MKPEDLNQFTGTEHYYKIANKAVLTDGTKYVADELGAYWLFTDTAIYIPAPGPLEGFAVIRLESVDAQAFKVMLGDGNGAWQHLFSSSYTDFPRDMMPFEFWAEWSGEFWVFLLPSEH